VAGALHVGPRQAAASYRRCASPSQRALCSHPGAIIPLRTPARLPARVKAAPPGTSVDVPEALTLWVCPCPSASPAPRGGRRALSRLHLRHHDGVSVAHARRRLPLDERERRVWRRGAEVAGPAAAAALEPSAAEPEERCGGACTIQPGGGRDFAEMPEARSHGRLRLIGTWPPATVVVGSRAAELHQSAAVPDAWGDNAAWPPGSARGPEQSGCGCSVEPPRCGQQYVTYVYTYKNINVLLGRC